MPGSFFDTVPSGGDAHAARLLLVERVIAGPNEGLDAAFSDLNMLVGPGGRERTEDQYATRLASAGFRLTTVVPTASDVSVIDAVPVPAADVPRTS